LTVRRPKYCSADEADYLYRRVKNGTATVADIERAVKVLDDALIYCDHDEVKSLKATCRP